MINPAAADTLWLADEAEHKDGVPYVDLYRAGSFIGEIFCGDAVGVFYDNIGRTYDFASLPECQAALSDALTLGESGCLLELEIYDQVINHRLLCKRD